MLAGIQRLDLANYDAYLAGLLAEQSWEHVQRRTAAHADIHVINPMMPDGRERSSCQLRRFHHGITLG